MLLIHKPRNHKLLTLGITSICIIGALLGLSTLTYTPELSHAETTIYQGKETRTMADITYMQQITPEICQNSTLNQQYMLTDKRDMNTYNVARIKNRTNDESNCWMTQNLDLNIPASGLTANLTDIKTDWNRKSIYKPEATQTTASPSLGTTINGIKSWDPGIHYCDNSGCSLTTSTNGGHDAQGNYYSWGAVTAGQAASIANTESATQSICPKRWTIPTSGGNDKQYPAFLSGAAISQITASPYYFVHSGRVVDKYFYYAGSDGFYWSSTAYSKDDYAYLLGFDLRGTYPANSYYRYIGGTVRCVARTESVPNNDIEINIDPAIELDVTNEVVVEKSNANPSTADLDVKVASNQPYSVNINATDHAELASTTSDAVIPSASGALTDNTNAWGIQKPNETTFTKVTTSPQLFYQSSAAELKTIPFVIGISTSPDLPSGEYSTNLTVTATQN